MSVAVDSELKMEVYKVRNAFVMSFMVGLELSTVGGEMDPCEEH